MTLSSARATYGLSAFVTPTATNASGQIAVGQTNTNVSYSAADVVYSVRAIFAGSGDALAINLTSNDTTGSTSWVAGTQQIETNTVTAASGITGSGNATVTVTATGMTGTPKAISVALTAAAHTTATLIAAALATGLNADTDFSALFVASSSGANLIVKRLATSTYTVNGASVNVWPADVANLNVAIANGTCTGITTAATSTSTTAGVITDGVKIYDGDGNDVEGVDVPTISYIKALLLKNSGDSAISVEGGTSDIYSLVSGEVKLSCGAATAGQNCGTDTGLTLTAGGTTELTLTIIGES